MLIVFFISVSLFLGVNLFYILKFNREFDQIHNSYMDELIKIKKLQFKLVDLIAELKKDDGGFK